MIAMVTIKPASFNFNAENDRKIAMVIKEPALFDSNQENAKKIFSFFNLLNECEKLKKIKSENQEIIKDIEKVFDKCIIFKEIEKIFKLQKVKQIFLINKFGDLINKTLSLQNEYDLGLYEFLIPKWKELCNKKQPDYNDSKQDMENSFKKSETTMSDDKSKIFSNDTKNLSESETEFFRFLQQIRDQLDENSKNNLDRGNFRTFFEELKKVIDLDCKEVDRKLYSIFCSLMIIVVKLIEHDPYKIDNNKNKSSKKENHSYSSDNKFSSTSHKNEPSLNSENIQFSRRLFVPEFDVNIISIRVGDIMRSKADLELNENEIIICANCKSFFYEILFEKSNCNWTCQFCSKDNTFTSLESLNFQKTNLMDVEYNKKKECIFKNHSNTKFFVLCIDISGSMSGSRMEIVKKASIDALNALLEKSPDTKVALITFQSDSCYHGDGKLNESIREYSKQDMNDMNYYEKIKTKSCSIRPIRESFNDLKTKIDNLQGIGGTIIRSALIHSVKLASVESNSEVLLCTDGEAQDKCEEFYLEITNFCNRTGFIKINVLTFSDSCDLKSLGILASETKGFCEKLSSSNQFSQSFVEIANNFIKTEKSESVKLIIFAQNSINLEDSGTNKYEIENIDSNEQEILIKYKPRTIEEVKYQKEFCFQFQIQTNNSVRVITKKLKNETNCNEKLIFAYSIRKIANLLIDENKNSDAERFLEDFSKYTAERSYKAEKFEEIAEMIKNRNRRDDYFYALVHNYRNIRSDQILLTYTKAPEIENEFLNEFKFDNELIDFKKCINEIFTKTNLEEYGFEQKLNIYKLLVVVKLIDKSVKIIRFLDKELEQKSQLAEQNIQTKDTEEILETIKNEIKPLISLKQTVETIGQDFEQKINDLIERLNVFFNTSFEEKKTKESVKIFEELRLKLTEFELNKSYDFKYDEIEKRVIEKSQLRSSNGKDKIISEPAVCVPILAKSKRVINEQKYYDCDSEE